MMDIPTFRQFLIALREEGACQLTGSFARHENDLRGHLSDIDLVCPEKAVDDYGEVVRSFIQDCVRVFERFGVAWSSPIIGSIGSPRDTTTLPRPVEVMEAGWASIKWKPPAGRKISVYGVDFPTFTPEPVAEDQ
jgi:hypothetical protein